MYSLIGWQETRDATLPLQPNDHAGQRGYDDGESFVRLDLSPGAHVVCASLCGRAKRVIYFLVRF